MNFAIKRSGLPQPGREISLEKFTLGLSHIVSGGATFGIGAKDTPIHVAKGDYIGKLRWLSRKYVVLWDEQDKRGWLVNGVSALLHALLGSLEFSRTDVFKAVFQLDMAKFKHNQAPATHTSAIDVLLNEENRRMVLYQSSSSTTTETVVDKNGVATTSTKTTTTNCTVEDKVVELYEYFERMIEYKTTIETSPGIKTKLQRPLQHLEGWDFNELVSMRDPLYLRVATLGPNSFSWVKFTRSIHAITLFGKGFGNILRNGNIQDRVPCHHLSEVPTQQCYLSVGNSDLMSIIENFDGDTTTDPMRLTTNLVWHNASYPRDPFDACPCVEGNDRPGFPVQQILPSGLRSRLVGPTSNLDDFEQGAVVFGQSNPFGLCRWILSNHGKCEDARSTLDLPESHRRSLSADNIGAVLSSHQPSSSITTQSPRASRSSSSTRSSPMTNLTSSDSDRPVAPSDSSVEAKHTDGLVAGNNTPPTRDDPSPSPVQVSTRSDLDALSAVSPIPSTGPVPDITISRTPIMEASVKRRSRLLEKLWSKDGAGHS